LEKNNGNADVAHFYFVLWVDSVSWTVWTAVSVFHLLKNLYQKQT